MRAVDMRFSGSDYRVLGLAEHLGIELADLDARTLPDAVAKAVIEKGIPDTAEARELFADLVRHATHEHRRPVRLSKHEARKRRRLLALGDELLRWARRAGAELRCEKPSARQIRGLESVLRNLARREGMRLDAIKHWCHTDPDAKNVINQLRPVEAQPEDHPLQKVWR